LVVILVLPCSFVFAQSLKNVDEHSISKSLSFMVAVPNQPELSGGHLQGIQLYGDILYVSGSSDRYGYLAMFKDVDGEFQYLGMKKLTKEPLNHAGGFQIAGNWLAIGLEDPKKKKHSIIQLIDVSSASTLNEPPTYTLERLGEWKLSTAGAVALLKRKDHFLLAVGSWDCTTIDFYTSNHLDPYKDDFEFNPWTTWDSRAAVRKNWTDKSYCSYQNLQLTEDPTGVYITGFGKSKKTGDKADVYLMNTASNPYDLMKKVATYYFDCKGEVTFRNGGGFSVYKQERSILAVGRNLSPKIQFQIFPIKAY